MRWLLLALVTIVAASGCSDSDEEPSAAREQQRAPERPRSMAAGVDWPMYGFDPRRTHAPAGLSLQPPFRRLWTIHGDWTFFEGPPVVANGRLYVGTNGGLVLAVDAASGRTIWERDFDRCVAASPAVAGGLVYVPLMGPPPCRVESGGGVVAVDAKSGASRWRVGAGVVESSPLVLGRTVYFGSWDHRVWAVDARSGTVRWRFRTGGKVKAGASSSNGRLYVASYDGHLYSLDPRSGQLQWASEGGPFYSTPAVAGGRVFGGSIDGRVYAFDAEDGRSLWSGKTGSYVYSSPAVWRGTVYVGSYDHRLYAFDARTGRRRWAAAAGHPISGAPTVLGGLVYFATCGSCSDFESDPNGRRSFAADARTGEIVWRFPDGEYSPLITDGRRAYLAGFTSLYGLAPK